MWQIKNMVLGVTVLFVITLMGNAQTSQKPSKDESLIRANVEQMAKGWNGKSAVEFAKPFAENADYVVNNGLHIKKFPSNVSGLQRLFETVEKNSMVRYTIEQIRFLRKDVAVVHVVGDMKEDSQSGQGRITLVMTKEKNKWVIATFQNTGIKPLMSR
ncbi:MAG: SgcJ/EcaC family oxidoreductase [Acidobacteria bacterium]|nr:SgcJ/EcaC family oxidoreductase [Acidobacteriota bacterium]